MAKKSFANDEAEIFKDVHRIYTNNFIQSFIIPDMVEIFGLMASAENYRMSFVCMCGGV